MGPPKDYPKERRQSKEPTRIQRLVDAALLSALMGGIAFGNAVHTRGVDNSYKIERMDSDVQRIEKDQENLKKIVYTRLDEFEDRFRINELEIERIKSWQNKESR